MRAKHGYFVSLLGFLALATGSAAQATADGPDHYRVSGLASGSGLVVRAEPALASTPVGSLPAAADCLRSLGCQGGLSYQEFATLSAAEKQQRAAANPRWCKISYQGITGWVEGRYLAESGCARLAPSEGRSEMLDLSAGPRVVKATLRGRQFVDYQLSGHAGQKLDVSLAAANGQQYFNLNPPDSELAMFIGNLSGDRFSGLLPADGVYTVRVYLMRAAARRHESSLYTLKLGLSGQALAPRPASSDALIPGTPYHAAAALPCAHGSTVASQRCDAFVIRRGFDGTATLEVRLPPGALSATRRILIVKGQPVAADSPDTLTHTRQGDVTTIRIGTDEIFEVPDALIAGG